MPRSRSKYVVFKEKGRYHWKLVVRGKVVGRSVEGYAASSQARRAIEAFARHAQIARISDE